MRLLVVAVLALAAALWKSRREGDDASWVAGEADGWRAWACSYGVVLLSMAPLLRGWSRFIAPTALLPADAPAHAWLAQAIARGLPHGWVSVCSGGFPLGPHYQSLAVILAAALIREGVSTVSAVNALGIGATVAAPLLLMSCLRGCGARAAPACAGVSVALWCVTPYAFATPTSSFVAAGFLSQVVGIALALATARLVVRARAIVAWAGVPVLAALAMSAHAQVAVVTLAVLVPSVVLAADEEARERFVFAGLGALAAGVAIYLPGVGTMRVPISWSKTGFEDIATFPRQNVLDLLGGRILDDGRPEVFTVLVVVAAAGLLASPRARSSRAALAFLATALLTSMGGKIAQGSRLVELLEPHRAASLVPLACGAVVAFGLQAWLSTLSLLAPARPRLVALAGATVAVGAAFWGASERAAWLGERIAVEDDLRGEHECGPSTPRGYSTASVAKWLDALPPGRFIVDRPSFEVPMAPFACPSLHGLELSTSAQLGASQGGPGTQVGVLQSAFDRLDLELPGGDRRAESLGVWTVLHTRAHAPWGAWTVHARSGDVELSMRSAGTATVGVGCVRTEWRGADRALRDRLYAVDAAPGPYDDPRVLVQLDQGTGPVVETPVIDDCDASRAKVVEVAREPGAYEAVVDSPAPVDVVIRATYFPTWHIEAGGRALRIHEVAPGFVSARVPAGRHRVVAVVSPLPFYVKGLGAGAAVIGLLSILAAGRIRRPVRRRLAA